MNGQILIILILEYTYLLNTRANPSINRSLWLSYVLIKWTEMVDFFWLSDMQRVESGFDLEGKQFDCSSFAKILMEV
jgi:hypothetical protein